MTPEDRAKKALEAYATSDLNLDNGEMANVISFIATAIREAEDDALELGSAAAAGRTLYAFDNGLERNAAAMEISEAVRSLKHPTKD